MVWLESNNQSWRLDRERLLWLAGSLFLVQVPHVTRVPLWIVLGFLVFTAWRLAHSLRGVALPGRLASVFIQGLVVFGIFLHYGTLFGRNPGVALLVGLSGLKLLESHTRRDGFVVILLGYFLVVTNFLYSQSIPTGLYMFLVVLLVSATLIRWNIPARDLQPRAVVSLAAGLLVQAVPLMLVLFLLFPRISGPLWGLPEDAHSGISGLSDTMSPGNISQLSQSTAVAFRVKFDGPVPAPQERYWRGPVLWDTDGRTWSRGRFRGEPRQEALTEGVDIAYTVTLEPHDKTWLFLLDIPVQVPEAGVMAHDFLVTSRRPVRDRLRYRAVSNTRYELPEASVRQRQRALRLPPGSHPRTRELAERWRRSGDDDQAMVNRALDFFRQEGFYYTLKPPLLPGDSVDEFLFASRRGFCEHYAAAFTVLMRAAGIPARVVTGYQGGDVNPIDGYLVVRQRNAHAWAEVWLRERGWVRVDPTAAVSPDRIEQGVDTALPPQVAPIIGLDARNSARIYVFWKRLRYGWDAVNNFWNQWVLGYGPERQRDLLARLGVDATDWRQIAAALLLFTALPLLAVGLWLRRRLRLRPDPARRIYDRFCHKLRRRGVERAPGEGPRDFARRAAEVLPDARESIQRITDAYLLLRYSAGGGDPRVLARMVAAFRP